MSRKQANHPHKPKAPSGRHAGKDQPKVGTDPEAAEEFGGKLDFGIPANEATAENDDPYGRVKGPEKGTGPTRSGSSGVRIDGVGAPTGPAGAGSGGDLDPDFIGLDRMGGLANDPAGDTCGPDKTSRGGSAPFASGEPAEGKGNLPPGHVGGDKRVHGSTTNGDIDGSQGAGSTSGGEEELRDVYNEDETIDPLSGGPARANENRSDRKP
jgi:hypothetical protein